MANLTQTAIITRKVVRYTIFGVIGLIIGKFLFDASLSTYRHFFPAPPPPPTVTFGRLPTIDFPSQEKKSLSFILETPQGTLPTLETQAKVYFMPKLSPQLLSLDAAIKRAGDLGFKPEPQQKSETLYSFSHKSSHSTFEINIITGIFSISFDLSSDSSPIERIPPGGEVAASQIRSFLSSANLLPNDLSGPTSYNFLKTEKGSLVSALGQSEADLVKVNLFRKDYDNLPSFPATPDEANVWFMVSGAQERAKQMIAAEFHYFPVDETQFATYPLKTAEEAWAELQAGQAFIAGESQENTVVVRRIYLAYFDPKTPSEFFQPIVVFEGDGGFIAYLPAVSLDYYGN